MDSWETLTICINKKVNLNELISLVEKGYKNPLKKYNFSKSEKRRLTKDEFRNIKEFL